MFSKLCFVLIFLFDNTVYKILFGNTRYPQQVIYAPRVLIYHSDYYRGRSPATKIKISLSSKFSIDEEESLFLKLVARFARSPKPKSWEKHKICKKCSYTITPKSCLQGIHSVFHARFINGGCLVAIIVIKVLEINQKLKLFNLLSSLLLLSSPL